MSWHAGKHTTGRPGLPARKVSLVADSLTPSDIEAALAAVAPPAPANGGPALEITEVRSRQRTIRKMDFARPSKFNKDQLRTLQMLHDAFCRRASTYLSGTIRSLVEINVVSSEQVPYGDYVATLPVPTFAAVLDVHPLETNAMAAIDLPLLFPMLDRMLGGPGAASERVRELTEIEQSLAESLMHRLLEELSESWNDLVPVEFRLRGIEMNAQFAQIVPAPEPSVLIVMEMSIGTANGKLSICVPYRSIERVVDQLSAHRYFSSGGRDENAASQLTSSLQHVSMPVRAEIGPRRMAIDDVLAMKPGDIIPLGRRVADGVDVIVGTTRAYRATPGQGEGRVAIQIIERLDDLHS